jgi:hypothetical protein
MTDEEQKEFLRTVSLAQAALRAATEGSERPPSLDTLSKEEPARQLVNAKGA